AAPTPPSRSSLLAHSLNGVEASRPCPSSRQAAEVLPPSGFGSKERDEREERQGCDGVFRRRVLRARGAHRVLWTPDPRTSPYSMKTAGLRTLAKRALPPRSCKSGASALWTSTSQPNSAWRK